MLSHTGQMIYEAAPLLNTVFREDPNCGKAARILSK